MKYFVYTKVVAFLCVSVLFAQSSQGVHAQELVKSRKNLPAASIFFAPAFQTVLQGSIFEVSLFLNTNGGSINTMDITVKFPQDTLTLVKPSSGDSLIKLWLEPPVYSNQNGTIHFVGVIPNGIKTKAGLITTLLFNSNKSGEAIVSVASSSRLLANDGLGSDVKVGLGRAVYTIAPTPPGGPVVYSDTHPFDSEWYNNPNVSLSWEKGTGVTEYSYVFDNIPTTIPDNIHSASSTQEAYPTTSDGLWFFHIKAKKEGVWGGTTHFPVRIDTHPPAKFTPSIDFLDTSYKDTNTPREALISFFTTDDLSGQDHYEVAVVDLANAKSVSPVFIQTESPFTLSATVSDKFHVIVRAVDKGGNIRDESIEVHFPTSFGLLLKKNYQIILEWLIAALFGLFLLHYFIGHHLMRYARHILAILRTEKKKKEDDEMRRDTDVQ